MSDNIIIISDKLIILSYELKFQKLFLFILFMSDNKGLSTGENQNSYSFNFSIKKIFPSTNKSPRNKILITDTLYTQCNICLYYYIIIYHTDKCHHYMCEKCLEVWSRIKKQCPVCKQIFNRVYPKINKQ